MTRPSSGLQTARGPSHRISVPSSARFGASKNRLNGVTDTQISAGLGGSETRSAGTRLGALQCALLVAAASWIVGCHSVGAGTIPRDRADYSEAIGTSWMRQTLLNIVKIRYNTAPTFIDVSSVVAGYSVESQTGLNLSFPGTSLNGGLRFTDRPTISYAPLTGKGFVRGILMPIKPQELFVVVESGWNAEVILGTGLDSIAGMSNRQVTPRGVTPADPGFTRALHLMEILRRDGRFGLLLQTSGKGPANPLVFLDEAGARPESAEAARELRGLLGLDPKASHFPLVVGTGHTDGSHLAVRTRSMIQILTLIASEIQVPPKDIREGRTMPGPQSAALPYVAIRCSTKRPADSLVAIEHRGHWFWVDDRDVHAKRGFSMLMLLFTLMDSSESASLPVLTIPTQ